MILTQKILHFFTLNNFSKSIEPEWDVQPVDNIIMKKVLSDRKNAEVIEQQERMHEEAKIKGRRNKKRLKEIRKMQKDLRQKFIETNDFINECEQKECEADKKIAAEMEIQKKLQNDIEDYQERIRKLTEYHDEQLKPAIKELSIYEDVLQEVVDDMDLFESKEDFLDRVEALCKPFLHCFVNYRAFESECFHFFRSDCSR